MTMRGTITIWTFVRWTSGENKNSTLTVDLFKWQREEWVWEQAVQTVLPWMENRQGITLNQGGVDQYGFFLGLINDPRISAIRTYKSVAQVDNSVQVPVEYQLAGIYHDAGYDQTLWFVLLPETGIYTIEAISTEGEVLYSRLSIAK